MPGCETWGRLSHFLPFSTPSLHALPCSFPFPFSLTLWEQEGGEREKCEGGRDGGGREGLVPCPGAESIPFLPPDRDNARVGKSHVRCASAGVQGTCAFDPAHAPGPLPAFFTSLLSSSPVSSTTSPSEPCNTLFSDPVPCRAPVPVPPPLSSGGNPLHTQPSRALCADSTPGQLTHNGAEVSGGRRVSHARCWGVDSGSRFHCIALRARLPLYSFFALSLFCLSLCLGAPPPALGLVLSIGIQRSTGGGL